MATTSRSNGKVYNRDVILTTSARLLKQTATGLTEVIDAAGNIDVPITTTNLSASGNSALGDSTADTLTVLGNSTFTGTATGVSMDVVGASVTTGKVFDSSDLAAFTTGKGIHLDATGITHTSGILAHLDSAGTVITGAGRIFLSDHTGVTTTSGILNEFKSAANDETVVVKITAASLTTGIGLDVSLAGLTTGKGIDISDLDAITTGKAIHVDATGVTQTDGILVHIDSASTALTSTGRLLLVDHTGAASVSGILAEVKSAAADETVMLQLTASAALALGNVLKISAVAATTAVVVNIPDLDALTTGDGMNIISNSADTGTRNLLKIVNDNTAATGTTGLLIQNDATAGAHISLTGTGVLGINFTALGATDKLFDATAASGCSAAPQTNAAIGFIGIKIAGTDQWIPYYDAT